MYNFTSPPERVSGVPEIHHFHRWLLRACAVLVLLLGLNMQAEASHHRYGNISWRVVQSDPTGRTIEFRVSRAARRSYFGTPNVGGIVSEDYLYFGDGSYASIDLTVTSVNVAEDWFFGEMTTTHRYTANGNFTAYVNSCCRIGTLFNNAGASWAISTLVNVGNSNSSPVSTLPPIVNLATGQAAATFTVPASDPNGQPLTYSLATASDVVSGFVNAPGMTINSTTGQVTFPTTNAPLDRLYNAVVKISDGQTSILVDFIIRITGRSTPPMFDYSVTPPNNYTYQVPPGTPVSFTVRAVDGDPGDVVTLQAIGLPPSATMSPALPVNGNPVQSSFSWTPTATNLGTNVINFVAQDATGVQTTTAVVIQVSQRPIFNVPPTIAAGSVVQVTPGTVISHTIQASDPDPTDRVSLVSASVPSGATFSPALPTPQANPTSTQLSWTTQLAQWGQNTLSFTARDTYGDQTTHSYVVVVNTPPTFASSAITTATVGVPYSYTIQVVDPDLPYGDLLDLLAPTLPAWLTLTDNGNGTGTLSGTPTAANLGANPVSLLAEDIYHHGYNQALSTQAFTINVGQGGGTPCSPAFQPTAGPDQFSTCAAPITMTAAQLLANDTDPQGAALMIASVGAPSSGTLTDNGNQTYTFTPAANGPSAVTFSYVVKKMDDKMLNPSNGHFYEYVPAADICWTAANTAAQARTYYGLSGYLATPTTAAENSFMAGSLSGHGWLGASDAAAEGVWRWTSGPEAGQLFVYSNWMSGEPNNYLDEDYAVFYAGAGNWNDLRDCALPGWIGGYYVEYGDNLCTPLLSATGLVTINVTGGTQYQPTAVADQLTGCGSFTFAASQLLANDTDPQGMPLMVASVSTPSSGTLVDNGNQTYTFTPDMGTNGPVTFSYVVKKQDNKQYFNGHFYEYVPATDICWTAANTAAQARTYYGLSGYLATPTTAAENSFMASKLSGHGWLGGSDAATEGVWRWTSGPEAGTTFWTGGPGGSASGFANWMSGEPNNYLDEDYAVFYAGAGNWNDLRNCALPGWIGGYYVEYGGTSNCAPALTATGTAIIDCLSFRQAGHLNQLAAYPNPMKDQATVSFRPATTGKAQLQVYNPMGVLVATLFEGEAVANQLYTRTLDGHNLATGVYSCRLLVGGKSETTRLVVVK